MKQWTSVALITILMTAPLFGQDRWEGSAAQVRRGEFLSDGLYAASNSFPKGTIIEVTNPATGKSVAVTVEKRIDSGSRIFLLLSPEAAQSIGMKAGDVDNVSVRRSQTLPLAPTELGEEITRSEDPDRNPQAGLDQLLRELEGTTSPTTESVAAIAETQPILEVEAELDPDFRRFVDRDPQKQLFLPPMGEEIVATQPEPEPEPTVEIVTTEPTATPSDPIGDLASRDPQKQLFLPPREEEIAVSPEPARPVLTETTPIALVEPLAPDEQEAWEPPVTPEGAPEITSAPPRVVEEPLVDQPLFQPIPPEDRVASRPEVTESVITPPEAEIGSGPQPEPGYPLQPAGDVPRHKAPTGDNPIRYLGYYPDPEVPADTSSMTAEPSIVRVEPESVEEPTTAVAAEPQQETDPAMARPRQEPVVVERLVLERTTPRPPAVIESAPSEESVEVAVSAISPPLGEFPFYIQLGAYSEESSARTVEREYQKAWPVDVLAKDGRGLYRVVIGPLAEDETGLILYRFQAIGFQDAFVQTLH